MGDALMNCKPWRQIFIQLVLSPCLISVGVTNLKECVEGAKHVQECVFEDLEEKKKVGHHATSEKCCTVVYFISRVIRLARSYSSFSRQTV